MLTPSRSDMERGATAIFLAFSMLLLLGVLAVALDLSSGFNERNQDQNAGDNGVMSGALEKAVGNPSDQLIVTRALEIAQANLTADFPGGQTDPAWIALWRTCIDDGNPGWIPLPEPASWGGGGTLDCVSQTTSLLRVRIPDQLQDTTFGTFLGSDTLVTNAVSIAKVALLGGAPPVVPFGVASGASSGHHCLSTAPDGKVYPPCSSSQTGSYGSIISPLFGDFGTHAPVCNGNTNYWFERNLVWGLDHRIKKWSEADDYAIPYVHPGKQEVLALSNTNRDDCALDPDGNATPLDGIELNTIKVDTGFPNPSLTLGLVSNETYDGRAARLQQPTTETRPLMNGNEVWNVDNVGPWTFLTETSSASQCRASTYTSLPDTALKTETFEQCLAEISASGTYSGEEVFTTTITSSPRFVWVPEYVFAIPPQPPPGGVFFNPVRQFRPAFLGGVWLNCPSPNAGPCADFFFPDADVTNPICNGCNNARVDQLSVWLLPDESLPASVFSDFEAAFANLEPELYQ